MGCLLTVFWIENLLIINIEEIGSPLHQQMHRRLLVNFENAFPKIDGFVKNEMKKASTPF